MSAGRVRRAQGSWRSVLTLAALSYALLLATSPLLHHDLACELKSRTHCTSCVSGISAPGLTSQSDVPADDMIPAYALPARRDVPPALSSGRSLQQRAPPAV